MYNELATALLMYGLTQRRCGIIRATGKPFACLTLSCLADIRGRRGLKANIVVLVSGCSRTGGGNGPLTDKLCRQDKGYQAVAEGRVRGNREGNIWSLRKGIYRPDKCFKHVIQPGSRPKDRVFPLLNKPNHSTMIQALPISLWPTSLITLKPLKQHQSAAKYETC